MHIASQNARNRCVETKEVDPTPLCLANAFDGITGTLPGIRLSWSYVTCR